MASVRLLLAFAHTAKKGSFAAAARELGLSASAVAKSVSRLEEQLDLRLFHRTTRRISLTPEGAALFERCQRVLDEIESLELEASEAVRVPSGTLRVDMPITYGKKVVLPAIARLVERYPALQVDLRLSERHVDLVGSGLDAVVRIGEVSESGLVARRFDEMMLGVYASPAYLRRYGRPQHPSDLTEQRPSARRSSGQHRCILFRMPTTGRIRPWHFQVAGEPLVVNPRPDWVIDDGEGLTSAAAAGLGLVQVPANMVTAALADGSLEEVLVPFRPPPMPISVVYPSNRLVPLRVRALIDALIEQRRAAGR